MRFVVLYIFIAAGLLRFLSLDQSFWLDEAITARVVQQYDLLQIVQIFSPTDFHPPLYYLFLDVWAMLFGVSEVSLRAPSILFSLLGAAFVYRLMLKKEGIKPALTATGLFLLNPLVMYYSIEARMYMMMTAWIAMLLFAIERLFSEDKAIQKKAWIYLLIANAAMVLSIWTFYGTLLMIAAVFLLVIVKKQWKMLLPLLPGPVLAALVVAPLTWQQLQNASSALVQVANWDLVLGSVTLKNLLLIPVKLVIGRISWDPQWFYLLSAGVLTAAVWYLAWRGSRHYNRMRVYLIVPITLGIMVSFWFPMLQYFRFLFLAVPMSVAIGYGVSHNRWLRNGMIGLFLILSLIYLTFSTFHREDWKHLLISVPIEKPVYMIWEASDPVQYYYSDHPIIDLRRLEPGTDLSVLDPTINRPGVVGTTLVVVPYAAAIHGVAYQDYLDERGYALIEQEDFNGVPLQFWERQSP